MYAIRTDYLGRTNKDMETLQYYRIQNFLYNIYYNERQQIDWLLNASPYRSTKGTKILEK